MKKSLTLLSLALSFVSLSAFAAKKEAKEDFSTLPPAEAAKKIIESNDLDKDSKLSPKEVNFSFRKKRFKTVDANQDGFLDEAELEASYANSSRRAEQEAAKNAN